MIFIGSYPFSWYTLEVLLHAGVIPKKIITIKSDEQGDFFFYKQCIAHELIRNEVLLTVSSKSDLKCLSMPSVDYIITSAFPYLIPESVLAKAKLYALNVHPSILPRWKGPDPIRNAILADDKYIGVSIHEMTSVFDEGNVVAQYKLLNDRITTYSAYIKLLAVEGGNMAAKIIKNKCKYLSPLELSQQQKEEYAGKIGQKILIFKDLKPNEYARIIS